MSDVFPMHQQPTLRAWLRTAHSQSIREAVQTSLTDNPSMPVESVDQLTTRLRVPTIELGGRYFDDRPRRRLMTAGPYVELLQRGIYPGQQYDVDYDVYRIEVVAGADMISVGANGGPLLDPTFVSFEDGGIVLLAADDRHRDQLIAALEKHIAQANKIIEAWNTGELPAAVEKELAAQRHQRAKGERREAAKVSAGFAPAPRRFTSRVPLPDLKHRPNPRRATGGRSADGVDYTLDADQFADILNCMAAHRDSVERLPGAGAPAEATEDDHRDQLLGALNLRFRDGSAESFSKEGKTDVRLVVADRSYFYAECKIWSGPSSVDEAMSQLSGKYLTYRDPYGALVFFVRGLVNPAQVPMKAIDWLVSRHSGERDDDVEGMPVVRVQVDGRSINLAVVMIVVDSAPARLRT